MYESWKQDNSSVHASWDAFFKSGEFVDTSGSQTIVYYPSGDGKSNDSVRLLSLIRAFQRHGHMKANLDPLGIAERESPEQLDPAYHGFTESDLTRPLNVEASNEITGIGRYSDMVNSQNMTLQDIIAMLEANYCNDITFQYAHVENAEARSWMRAEIEAPQPKRTKDEVLSIVEQLAKSDKLENFYKKKFSNKKRFGLEGTDSLIPGLKAMIDEAARSGVEDFVIGMPHRGRLNVMGNIVNKPVEQTIKEFQEEYTDDWSMSGDVKYHLGASCDLQVGDQNVHISLLPNPSHLETVNTVVLGKARCKLRLKDDKEGHTVLPIIMHGDAAFAGQGVTYETLQISRCEGYHTGGAIHVIVNNQIGFTTNPSQGRCTRHSSDLGKAFGVPIISVNADNIFEVDRAFRIALKYRQKFKTEVIVDLIGYRKNGHNEQDQPRTTQPLMYKKIDKQQPALQKFIGEVASSGVCTSEELSAVVQTVEDNLNSAFERSKDYTPPAPGWLKSSWEGLLPPWEDAKPMNTGVESEKLDVVAAALANQPENFKLERALQKVVNDKRKSLEAKKGIDWGTAEALAVGTLLMEGVHCRMSGQDVERGTFSHRHAIWHDQDSGEKYMPLNNISEEQTQFFSLKNSPLSEYGVLGFELGYSWETPNQLVMWEAQFGDFMNGAQVMIDQYISSGEAKWYRMSGLVMLLPHGYQGMGPEHSSCRIERFLQSSDEDAQLIVSDPEKQLQLCNWQVVNPTTPANYFHLLRRQVCRDYRKPLVVPSTKALLRHPKAVSDMEEFGADRTFLPVIAEAFDDELAEDEDINRLVFCSGKIYYELLEGRRKEELDDVAIVRIEQLSPFPFDLVADALKRYPNAEAIWSQEEPKNMGAWTHVNERITSAAKQLAGQDVSPEYVGRVSMAAPSEGSHTAHTNEQARIINTTLGLV